MYCTEIGEIGVHTQFSALWAHAIVTGWLNFSSNEKERRRERERENTKACNQIYFFTVSYLSCADAPTKAEQKLRENEEHKKKSVHTEAVSIVVIVLLVCANYSIPIVAVVQ